MTTKNPSIGTVPCPVPKCGETCQVKRFKNLATRDLGKRSAGKMYFDCSQHGRFGWDGKPAMQEYILEAGRINGAELPVEEPPAAEPAPAPVPAARAPGPAARAPAAPAAPTPPAKKPGWGYF